MPMILSRNNREQISQHNQAEVMFDGSPLQSVSEVKYLGVLLDSTLSFRKHIDCITSQAYGALSTLRKSQTHLPLATLKISYRSLVLPHLEYCPLMHPGIPLLSNYLTKLNEFRTEPCEPS